MPSQHGRMTPPDIIDAVGGVDARIGPSGTSFKFL
jgi:hypothetical protein